MTARLYATIRHKREMTWREAADLAVAFAERAMDGDDRWTTVTRREDGRGVGMWTSTVWIGSPR